MKLSTILARAAGLGLCVVAFSSTALADPGNGNGGPATTPPGQEQKAETPAATTTVTPAAAPAPQAASGQEQKAAPKPAPKSTAVKAAAPGQAKKADSKAKQAETKSAKAATPSKGQSANAHHHVIICHRTGSASNPYVVLNIPYTAWTNGHSTHPAKNGNSDKLLKDPASRPGSKGGFDKSACGTTVASTTQTQSTQTESSVTGCPAVTTTTEQVLVGVKHYTGAIKDGQRKFVVISPSKKSAHLNGKHADDVGIYETRTVTRTASGENCAVVTSTSKTPSMSNTSNVAGIAGTQTSSQALQATAAAPSAEAQAPAGGVAGAVSPTVKKPKSKSAGGVFGAVASAPQAIAETAASGTLPFTGFPLWIVALIAVAVLLAGVAMRRRPTA